MRNVKNIYISIIELVCYIILFCFMSSTMVVNMIHGSLNIVDLMVLIFNTLILICIVEHISAIRLYMRSVREKSHSMTIDD
jgi:uncharacterized membrane protein